MYRELSRAALLRRDPEELLAYLEPICRAVIAPFFLPGADRDDLMQEARIAAAAAIEGFRRSESPGHFVEFARLVIRRRVITAVRMANLEKRRALNGFVSLDEPHRPSRSDPDGGMSLADVLMVPQASPDELIADRDRVRALMSDVEWRLSDLERQAFVGVEFEGRSYDELGRRKAIDNAVQRARRKLTEWDRVRRAA